MSLGPNSCLLSLHLYNANVIIKLARGRFFAGRSACSQINSLSFRPFRRRRKLRNVNSERERRLSGLVGSHCLTPHRRLVNLPKLGHDLLKFMMFPSLSFLPPWLKAAIGTLEREIMAFWRAVRSENPIRHYYPQIKISKRVGKLIAILSAVVAKLCRLRHKTPVADRRFGAWMRV